MTDLMHDWALVGYRYTAGETLPGGDDGRRRISAYLVGDDLATVDELEHASGLHLTIRSGARFEQAQDDSFQRIVFDAEGVSTPGGRYSPAAVFGGRLVQVGTRAYLHPDHVPSWAAPSSYWGDPRLLRYDDGDTVISDWVERVGDRLARTISVVTDQAYPARVTLLYSRAS